MQPGYYRRTIIIVASWGLITLVLCLCSCHHPDLLEHVDKPITLREAQHRGEDFPFPMSASNIYYAEFIEWQEHEFILRFQSPGKDCVAAIPAILKWYNNIHHTSVSYTPVRLPSPTILPRSTSLTPVDWFDSMRIQDCIYAGANVSQAPNIWIDMDKDILYYRESD
jgi:hypothetical protein